MIGHCEMCSARTKPKERCPVSYVRVNSVGQVISHVPSSCFPRTNINVNLYVHLINILCVYFVEGEVVNTKKTRQKNCFVSRFLHLDKIFP